MKLGYLIYTKYESERNIDFINLLILSAKKYNIILKPLIYERLSEVIIDGRCNIKYGDIIVEKPDFVIQRVMNYQLSKHIELMGVRVFNSSKVSQIADNKFNTYQFVSSLKIPIQKTILQNKMNNNVFFPNVTKPLNSKGGDRVTLNKTLKEYSAAISLLDNDFILQEPAKDIGKDLRVYVIGKEIVLSILRTSNSGFLSTYCKGGTASLYDLTNEEKETVYKIVNSLDVDYVGIDFLFNDGKLTFNEIENVVGARMVYELTNINIGELYIKYINNCIRN